MADHALIPDTDLGEFVRYVVQGRHPSGELGCAEVLAQGACRVTVEAAAQLPGFEVEAFWPAGAFAAPVESL